MTPWDRADQHRFRTILAGALALALVTIPGAAVIWLLSQPHIAIACSGITVPILTALAGTYLRLTQACHAHQMWRRQEGALTFLPSTRTMAWNLLEILVIPCGCLLLVTGALLMAALIAVVVRVALATPAPRPGAPAIVLTPQGVWLWPHNRVVPWIPWDCCPALTVVHRGADAVIATLAHGHIRFPTVYLPLRYAQLHHLLELFTTRPDLRLTLAGPEGLALVQALMHTPADPAEHRRAL